MTLVLALLTGLEFSPEVLEAWDRLAALAQRPHSGPAWVLAWWRHVADSELSSALITATDGSQLVGVMALARRGANYATPGGDLISVEPLAQPGRESEVAAAFAEALRELEPAPASLALELRDDSPDWPRTIAAALAKGKPPWSRVVAKSPCPRLDLGEADFEAWLAAKSANFRRDFRRKQRRLESEGVTVRDVDADTLEADVSSFLPLHLQRHAGGSSLRVDGVEEMLVEVGCQLLPEGRFRLLQLEFDGEAQAGLLLSSAGGSVSAWSSGFSERLARHTPIMQLFVEAIRGMADRGERSLDLGPGSYDYKDRIASEAGSLRKVMMIFRGHGYARARCTELLHRTAAGVARRLRAGTGKARS